MDVDEKVIRHLAELSCFNVSKTEVESLTTDLKGIIGYISQLDQLDAADVEPTYQVFEMENVWREDEILPQEADREALLALTKETKDNQIKVPKVL